MVPQDALALISSPSYEIVVIKKAYQQAQALLTEVALPRVFNTCTALPQDFCVLVTRSCEQMVPFARKPPKAG